MESEPESTEAPDWLRRLRPESPELPAAETEPVVPPSIETEVPDSLAEPSPTETEPTAPQPEAEVPDWLARLAPTGEEPAEAPLPQEEVPDWLTELASAGAEPELAPPTEAEVPDWLADMTPAEAEPSAAPPPEAEVPDWLAEPAPAEAESELAPPTEAEVPDWLAGLGVAEEGPIEIEPAEAPLPETEVPDWLPQLAPAEEDLAEPTEVELPDWLAELGPTDEGLAAPPIAEAQVPEWLVAPTPSEPSDDVGVEAGLAPEDAGLAQAEIPAWLQAMRAGVTPTPVSEEEEIEVETSGLLAGIAGVIQPASVVAAQPSAPIRAEQIGAEATLARARLWQELIARSAQPVVSELPQVRARKARGRVERWLIYGILLLAVFVPIFADMDLSSVFDLDGPSTTLTGPAYDLIDELTAGAPVLMAFDYDASHMGELHVQAEALFRHLAQRQARIVTVSLTPEGAGLAQQLFEDVLSSEGYQAGQEFVNLGYLPGEAVGVRSLDFLPGQFQDWSFDGKTLKDALIFDQGEGFALSNMSLLVVLTGNANNLRWWVEQTTALETDLTLVAGVSAAIEPLVRPYYDMEPQQIDGLVVGLMGAFDYENELNLDGPAHLRLNGQLVGQVAVLLVIVFGVLVHRVSRRGEADA